LEAFEESKKLVLWQVQPS